MYVAIRAAEDLAAMYPSIGKSAKWKNAVSSLLDQFVVEHLRPQIGKILDEMIYKNQRNQARAISSAIGYARRFNKGVGPTNNDRSLFNKFIQKKDRRVRKGKYLGSYWLFAADQRTRGEREHYGPLKPFKLLHDFEELRLNPSAYENKSLIQRLSPQNAMRLVTTRGRLDRLSNLLTSVTGEAYTNDHEVSERLGLGEAASFFTRYAGPSGLLRDAVTRGSKVVGQGILIAVDETVFGGKPYWMWVEHGHEYVWRHPRTKRVYRTGKHAPPRPFMAEIKKWMETEGGKILKQMFDREMRAILKITGAIVTGKFHVGDEKAYRAVQVGITVEKSSVVDQGFTSYMDKDLGEEISSSTGTLEQGIFDIDEELSMPFYGDDVESVYGSGTVYTPFD